MRQALSLARRGLGDAWPNPAVGCVIVRDGRVIARGWTQSGGRPHAEAEALRRAGDRAQGATAYVTLEPCAHHGKTPPCADALVTAGIARCVTGIRDPDPRVSGAGLARLRDAGVEVEEGVLAAEATAVTAGFLSRIDAGRPLVIAKLATSLDGLIATHTGESQWITGAAARQRAHALRAECDAVMVGSATAAQDDPELTCRLPGFAGRPRPRIVVDGRLRLPLTAKLVRTARTTPTWLVTRQDVDRRRLAAYVQAGVEPVAVGPGPDGAIDLAEALAQLGQRGLTSLLVEGGGGLVAALLRARLVDRLAWFRAAALIGGDGIAAVARFGVDRLDQAVRWRHLDAEILGDDVLETFVRKP
jgi:diaminohydroxyphosphoribosylaminopyrimidine deaminase/5-amino-6-(5-phosphoribosylamino)uracil reductase